MKVLVLGDGLLGSEIIKQTGWDFISRKKDGFDITDPSCYKKYFLDINYDVGATVMYSTIVNCIANTDTYSKNKEEHWKVNYEGVANLTDFCNEWNIKLVHISTDYVYTNSTNEASEDDIPIHGNNWYSYTKLLADAYIELKSKNYLICRGTHKPNPFIYNKAWIDQIGNFDYVNKIALLIIKLIKVEAKGIYNIGTELKSIYNLALQTNNQIMPFFKPENTPLNTSMNLNKLKNAIKGIN